jgi:TonB family protein
MSGRLATAALLLPLLLANARAADPPAAEPNATAPQPVDLDVFQGVRILRTPSSLAYPEGEREQRREGWVMLNMMIDPNGKPYEVTVLDSSGNSALEKAAVRALGQMSFQPAKLGRTPIDSSLSFKMRFYMGEPIIGASSEFIAAYRRFTKSVDAGDKAQADAQMPKLQVENLYEDAFKAYAQYFYDRKWGTDAEQLADLERAVAGEDLGRYLPRDAFHGALAGQFGLEVKLKDYGSALATWKTLGPIAPTAIRAQLQPIVDQINGLANSDQPIITSGSIDNRASWNSRLFRHRFSLAVKNGAVSEIKLRCKKKYVFFKYDPAIQYAVSPSAGECEIEVVGDPGTTFDLTQS